MTPAHVLGHVVRAHSSCPLLQAHWQQSTPCECCAAASQASLDAGQCSNEVERLFRRIKAYRRVFARYDKLDVMFATFVSIALSLNISGNVNTP